MMSMGIRVFLTGALLFFFFGFMMKIGKQEPVTPWCTIFAYPALIGLVMMPTGILVWIWQK